MIIMACIVTMFCEIIQQARIDFDNFITTVYKHNRSHEIVHNNQPFDWEIWTKENEKNSKGVCSLTKHNAL